MHTIATPLSRNHLTTRNLHKTSVAIMQENLHYSHICYNKTPPDTSETIESEDIKN